MTEFAFLEELTFLCDAAFERGERITTWAREWSEVDRKIRDSYESSPTRMTADQRAAEQRFRTEALGPQVTRQTKIFSELDAFLSVYGRASLILFPQYESSNDKQQDRARTLRANLGIDESHPLSDRRLRNKWVHLDERLDDLDEELADGQDKRPMAQRFITSDRFHPSLKQTTVRLLVTDKLAFHYRGVGSFNIGRMIRVMRELEPKVRKAQNAWTENLVSELGQKE